MASDASWGVFDSGLGGLTVLKSLALQFPSQNFVYLGDTARVPYGGKSPATIRHYSLQILKELSLKNTRGLIVACNTASAQLPEEEFEGLPLLKVIKPGAITALQATRTGRIGIIGTRGTIASGAYEKKLKAQNPDVQVFSQACPLFVPIVEEGWIDDPLTNLVVYRYLQPLLVNDIDTLILGCTHYPILRNVIQKVVGPNVTLVESGSALGEYMRSRWPDLANESGTGTLDIELTDASALQENLVKQFLLPLTPRSIQAVPF